MSDSRLTQKPYRDDLLAAIFNDNIDGADISGVVPSEHFRKEANGQRIDVGRTRLVGNDANGNPVFEKVKDDIQFKGRCYEGDGSAYIDVSSFVTGSLTAIAEYYNDGTGWVEDYILTTEINNTNKRITIADGDRMAHLKIYEDAVLVAEYSGCEDPDSAPVLYDILEPNGNNGTLVNGIAVSFYVEDSNVPYSHLNQKGYNVDGSGNIIPASLANPDEDVLGNPLEYKGSLAPRTKIVDNSCLVLNGVDQFVTFGAPVFNAYDEGITIAVRFKTDAIVSQTIASSWSTDTSSRVFALQTKDTGVIRIWNYNGGNVIHETINTFNDNNWHHLFLRWENGAASPEIIVDGVEQILNNPNVGTLGTFTSGVDLYVGRTPSAAAYFEGQISDFNLTYSYFSDSEKDSYLKNLSSDNWELVLPISEGNGTTIYDVSGNNNHGTVVNAVLPDIWGTQDVFAWNFYEGYWLYEDSSSNQMFIPTDAGASFIGPESVVFNRVGFVKGFKETGKWNGAGKLQFPDIPEMPIEVRGLSFTLSELLSLEYVVFKYDGTYVWDIEAVKTPLSSNEKIRQGFYIAA